MDFWTENSALPKYAYKTLGLLNAKTLRLLVVFATADMSAQYFGWQDHLFSGGGKKAPDRHESKRALAGGLKT
jgi:hypothetical protein